MRPVKVNDVSRRSVSTLSLFGCLTLFVFGIWFALLVIFQIFAGIVELFQ